MCISIVFLACLAFLLVWRLTTFEEKKLTELITWLFKPSSSSCALMTKIPGYRALSIVSFFKHSFQIVWVIIAGETQLPIMKKEHPRRGFDGGLFLQPTASMVCSISGQALGVWLPSHQPSKFCLIALRSMQWLFSYIFVSWWEKSSWHDPSLSPKVGIL